MIISHTWLQSYFKDTLPTPKKIAEGITMHAFEIESLEERNADTLLDVKVLPNRAHDCLSHRGIATEIAALFSLPINATRFEKYEKILEKKGIEINFEDFMMCPRYVGRLIENITINDSPEWLKERLSSLGQRPINVIVDICNYVMFDIGQPMHAFDADQVKGAIVVRKAANGETITTLDKKEVVLDETMIVIADEVGPLAIAGIKGGNRAEVDIQTTRIILEAANFNSTRIRKTSQKIGIKTDASKRFENEIAPELANVGIEYATSLIVENISREVMVHESVDIYPRKRNPYKVGVSLSEINRLLGTEISESEVTSILDRFGWKWEQVIPQEKILELAPKFIDVPYRMGASVSYDAPREFDCSSFVSYLYANAGVAIPRISIEQYLFGEPISETEAKPGDLLFAKGGHTHYFTGAEEGIGHVGLYIGDDKVINAAGQAYARKVVIEDYKKSLEFKEFRGFRRLLSSNEKRFVVTVPAERLDLRLKEDLIEDIGRMYGYDKLPTTLPEKSAKHPKINKLFYYSQKIRNILIEMGFDEVQTYAFQNKGEVELENPLASDKGFLRANLETGLKKSLELNSHNAELLGLDEVKIFEIGNVFAKGGEEMRLGIALKNVKKDKIKEDQKIFAVLEAIRIELGTDEVNTSAFDGVAEFSLSTLLNTLPEPLKYGDELEVP